MTKRHAPRAIYVLFIIFFGGVAVFILAGSLKESLAKPIDQAMTLAKQISDQCKNDNVITRQTCLEEHIVQNTIAHPASGGILISGFWELLNQKIIMDDPRLFSPIVHEVGMALADSNLGLTAAVQSCSLDFRGACVHGVFMEYIDNNYTAADPKTFFGLCDIVAPANAHAPNSSVEYMDCIHGVGHELAAKIKGSLADMLAPCATLPAQYQDECTSGVFMEYSKGTTGQGHHSDAPVGTKALDCSSVQSEFQSSCYISAGFYRQYEITGESWDQSFTFCSQAPAHYKKDCYDGIRSALLFANLGDMASSLNVCNSLLPANKVRCTQSIVADPNS